MKFYIGTSGYSYKEWKGTFYPGKLPANGMLRYYAERFNAVEINNTFYRMPGVSGLERWAGEVPSDFRFVLKAPRKITHVHRLKEAEGAVSRLIEVAAVLKDRLGTFFFQLPPNLKKDVSRLRDFLDLLPSDHRAAIEFRHPSWFDDEVFGLLMDHGIALCIVETEDGIVAPFLATTDWGYLRLRRSDYRDFELKEWVRRIRGRNWKDVLVFFKHGDAGKAPQMAKRFLELAALPVDS